jgi:hypothetical protein
VAFTETQKVEIRLYLGFPDVFQAGNPRLESAFDVIGARPETQAMVEAIMARIADAITAAFDTSTASAGGIKRVDEIEFFGTDEGKTAEDHAIGNGRRAVNQLSIIFGIPIVNDIFGQRGYRGDWWGSQDFQVFAGNGRGGGMIPMG